jgi:hypothetical protein
VSARRSVSRVLSHRASRRDGDGHPSGAAGRPTAHAADPRAGQRTSPPLTVARPRVAPSYLALLRVEFARFTPPAGWCRPVASSLWHWSSPCGGRALPATLRWGARTFLTIGGVAPVVARPSDRLADRCSLADRFVYPDRTAGGATRRVARPRRPARRDWPDRWPDWPAHRLSSSGRAGRAWHSIARTRQGFADMRSRAGSAWRP